jgi:hypothetical protein
MAIVINGSGTITGVSAGGLPDGSVDSDTLATGIDATKLADGSVTSTELQYINTLASNAQTQISAAGITSQSGAGNYTMSATGSLSITGVGFQPTCVFFSAVANGEEAASIGFMDSDGLEQCLPAYDNGSTTQGVWSTSGFLYDIYNPSTADRHKVAFTSYDADGFTVSRAETGTCTGDIYYVWLALK